LAKSTSRSPTCWGDSASDVVSVPALKARVPTAEMPADAAPEASGAPILSVKLEISIATKAAAIIDVHVRRRPERMSDRVMVGKHNHSPESSVSMAKKLHRKARKSLLNWENERQPRRGFTNIGGLLASAPSSLDLLRGSNSRGCCQRGSQVGSKCLGGLDYWLLSIGAFTIRSSPSRGASVGTINSWSGFQSVSVHGPVGSWLVNGWLAGPSGGVLTTAQWRTLENRCPPNC
jgi:hypothetical protein